jgi:hypothetical protein
VESPSSTRRTPNLSWVPSAHSLLSLLRDRGDRSSEAGDADGDGRSDLLWRDISGNTAIWFMNGLAVASTGGLGNIPAVWTVQSVNAE